MSKFLLIAFLGMVIGLIVGRGIGREEEAMRSSIVWVMQNQWLISRLTHGEDQRGATLKLLESFTKEMILMLDERRKSKPIIWKIAEVEEAFDGIKKTVE